MEGDAKSRPLEKLMRRFELDKKIFSSYDEELVNPMTTDEISKDGYNKLAICFCLKAVKDEDARFYNTALKISDLTDLRLPEIKF